jgi:hypothetical protein
MGSGSDAAHTGDVIPVLRTSLVTALVVGVLAAGGCSSAPRCPPGASCPPPPLPRVTFTTTINGKSGDGPVPRYRVRPGDINGKSGDGPVPRYRVRPGESLMIRVAVTVPRHFRLTSLAFGISTGSFGGAGVTGDMNPVLAHYRQPLSAGSHMFGLHWRMPRHRSRASLYLAFGWSSEHPDASVAGAVAQLILN